MILVLPLALIALVLRFLCWLLLPREIFDRVDESWFWCRLFLHRISWAGWCSRCGVHQNDQWHIFGKKRVNSFWKNDGTFEREEAARQRKKDIARFRSMSPEEAEIHARAEEWMNSLLKEK